MFTPEEILTRLKKQPFVPVRFKVSSGEEFDVYHPDLVLIGRRDVTIGAASKKNLATYDTQTRVAIMHITMLEDLPMPASSGPSNGQQWQPRGGKVGRTILSVFCATNGRGLV